MSKKKPKKPGEDQTKEGKSPELADDTPRKARGEETEPDFTADLDGAMTLDETRSACEVEQDSGLQLRGIRFKTLTAGPTVLLVNKADFMDKPTGRLKHLLFAPVGTTDPEKLRKEKEADNWKFICDSQIYVQDNVTRVMVFGKRKL